MATDPTAQAIQQEVDRRISEAITGLDKGNIPTSDDLAAIDRLQNLKDSVSRRSTPGKLRWEVGLLALLASAFALLVSIHLSASPAELEVKATRIALKLNRNHSSSLLPGEIGEVLGLRSAEITGADRIDPPNEGEAGTVILRQRAPRSDATGKGDAPPVLLQEVSIPGDASCRLVVGVAYNADLHGLTLESSGSQITSALLSVPVPDADGIVNNLKHVVSVEGKHLTMRIFPAVERSITIFRNTPISEIRFETEDAQQSSVLGGTVTLKEKTGGPVALNPGDAIEIRSDQPMSIRELSLKSGELTAKVAIPGASRVRVGPKEIMPNLFDWIFYRWPAQIYGCACAVVAFWLTLRKWWTNAS